MVAKKLNISIPEEMDNFLTDNPTLSPSQLLQSKIEEIENNLKHNPQLLEANKTIVQLQKARQKTQDELQKATEFITIKGMWEEYLRIP